MKTEANERMQWSEKISEECFVTELFSLAGGRNTIGKEGLNASHKKVELSPLTRVIGLVILHTSSPESAAQRAYRSETQDRDFPWAISSVG